MATTPCRKVVRNPTRLVRFIMASKGTVGCLRDASDVSARSTSSSWMTGDRKGTHLTQCFSTTNHRTRPAAPQTMVAITYADVHGCSSPPDTMPRMRTEIEGMKMRLPILLRVERQRAARC